jgi:hypothetical protein
LTNHRHCSQIVGMSNHLSRSEAWISIMTPNDLELRKKWRVTRLRICSSNNGSAVLS